MASFKKWYTRRWIAQKHDSKSGATDELFGYSAWIAAHEVVVHESVSFHISKTFAKTNIPSSICVASPKTRI